MMEMEIWERGVLKHQKMTSPATSYSPALYTHKQHSLCFYLNLPNNLRSSPPYIYFVFHRKQENTPDRINTK